MLHDVVFLFVCPTSSNCSLSLVFYCPLILLMPNRCLHMTWTHMVLVFTTFAYFRRWKKTRRLYTFSLRWHHHDVYLSLASSSCAWSRRCPHPHSPLFNSNRNLHHEWFGTISIEVQTRGPSHCYLFLQFVCPRQLVQESITSDALSAFTFWNILLPVHILSSRGTHSFFFM